jgi:hypothetical protein
MCGVARETVTNGRLIMDFSFTKSSVFQFLVGPAKTSFYIHTELAGSHSQPLSTLMQGEMMEAKQGIAHLEDITEDVFWCFTQYLYSGNYQSTAVQSGEDSSHTVSQIVRPDDIPPPLPTEEPYPAPEVAPIDEPPPVNDPFAIHEPIPDELVPGPLPVEEARLLNDPTFDWGFASVAKPKKKKKRRQPDEDTYHCRGVKGTTLWQGFQAGADNSELAQSDLNFVDVSVVDYLSHAHVYVFADRYDIPKLRELAVKKLHFFLAKSDLVQTRVAHVVDLVRYTYENTMEQTVGTDRLRDVVSEYAACQVEKLAKHSDFCKLLQDNGGVGMDLVPRMVKRLD